MSHQTQQLTSDKSYSIDVISRMADTVTLDQIAEDLANLAAIRRGRDDAEAGRLTNHDEVERMSASWFTK